MNNSAKILFYCGMLWGMLANASMAFSASTMIDSHSSMDAQSEALDGSHFILHQIVLKGVTEEKELFESLFQIQSQSLINKPVSLKTLQSFAQQFQNEFHQRGYFLTQVIIPAQSISRAEAKVTFLVIEGAISKIHVEPNSEAYTPTLMRYAERFNQHQHPRKQDLERLLLLVNDLPGVKASGLFVPSTQFGLTDYSLHHSIKHEALFFNAHNRVAPWMGSLQGQGSVTYNSIFSADKIIVSAAVSHPSYEHMRHFTGEYLRMIGADGLSLSANILHTQMRPRGVLPGIVFEGVTKKATIELVYPWLRTLSHSVYLHLSISGSESLGRDTVTLGSGVTNTRLRYKDQIMPVELGIKWIDNSPQKISQWKVSVHQGLGVWPKRGAVVPPHSRAHAALRYTKVAASYLLERTIRANISFQALLQGQWSATPLLASEQSSYGGAVIGSAYDNSYLVGDRSVLGRFEIRRQGSLVLFDQSLLPQYYLGVDFGRLWNLDHINQSAKSEAMSAMGGIRFTQKRWMGTLELAQPLYTQGRVSSENLSHNPRFFFNIGVQY